MSSSRNRVVGRLVCQLVGWSPLGKMTFRVINGNLTLPKTYLPTYLPTYLTVVTLLTVVIVVTVVTVLTKLQNSNCDKTQKLKF